MTARKFVIAAVAALTLGSTAQAMEITDITPFSGSQVAAEMPGEAGFVSQEWWPGPW
ncbi:MAG: hypothetical protein GDA40_07795 [Rhodobacteraceae bacterium]|nr:hypothetical protein [Paracoccaceae bacterium]